MGIQRSCGPGRRAGVRGLLLALLLVVSTACLPGHDHARAQLRIATGVAGGVYVPYGQFLARDLDRDVSWIDPSIVRSDGSVENLQMLAAGKAEVAFTASDVADDAVNGRGVFAGRPQKLTALARLYDDYVQLVTLKDGPVATLADLAGRRVSIGRPGSGTAIIARRIMDVAALRATAWAAAEDAQDVRTQLLDVEDSVIALEAGRIDAFFWSGGLPSLPITTLVQRKAVALVDLGETANGLASRFGDFYTSSRIPGNTYGLDAVRTVAVPNYLVAAPDADPEVVEAVTRVLFHLDPQRAELVRVAGQLDVRAALSTYPLDLHPGAVAYYRETHG